MKLSQMTSGNLFSHLNRFLVNKSSQSCEKVTMTEYDVPLVVGFQKPKTNKNQNHNQAKTNQNKKTKLNQNQNNNEN